MTGTFGTTPFPARLQPTRPTLEDYPRAQVGGQKGMAALVGGVRVEVVREWWSRGRLARMRPKFVCPHCHRTCRYLYVIPSKVCCRLCTGLDYASRYYRRFCPAISRLTRLQQKLTRCPRSHRAGILAEMRKAEAEVSRHLRRVVGDLDRRVVRHTSGTRRRKGQRSQSNDAD